MPLVLPPPGPSAHPDPDDPDGPPPIPAIPADASFAAAGPLRMSSQLRPQPRPDPARLNVRDGKFSPLLRPVDPVPAGTYSETDPEVPLDDSPIGAAQLPDGA